MLKNLVLVLAGAAGALALVVACSDDSPGNADAAVCDCDPAEPPLAGRIVRLENRRTFTTPGVGLAVACPDSALLLGGGCYGEGPAPNLTLIDSGSAEGGPLGWACSWTNQPTEEVIVVAWATCLLPAPSP